MNSEAEAREESRVSAVRVALSGLSTSPDAAEGHARVSRSAAALEC